MTIFLISINNCSLLTITKTNRHENRYSYKTGNKYFNYKIIYCINLDIDYNYSYLINLRKFK